jgi:hypothetical protein
MRMHPSITIDRVLEANQRYDQTLDNPGFCIACGADADGCEPDAERYECEECGRRQVYGAQQLLLIMA